jgi:hypothetical protein
MANARMSRRRWYSGCERVRRLRADASNDTMGPYEGVV